MGRCNYRMIARGMSKNEALQNAMDEDRYENGIHDGYNGGINSAVGDIHSKCLIKPVIAKKCTILKKKHEGTRKWETVFELSSHDNNMVRDYRHTQGEAIKRGKELSIKHNCAVEVRVKKCLVGSNNLIAEIKPKKSQMGQWEFYGEARE